MPWLKAIKHAKFRIKFSTKLSSNLAISRDNLACFHIKFTRKSCEFMRIRAQISNAIQIQIHPQNRKF